MKIPDLNRRQRVVVYTGALLIAATGLYPPWHGYPAFGREVFGLGTRFSFIFQPAGTLAIGTLAAEWFVILVLAGALLVFFHDGNRPRD